MKRKQIEKLLDDMVEYQIRRRGIEETDVLAAFHKVSRHIFVSKEYQELAYDDHPLPIGYGQTISQPYIVALTVSNAEIKKSDKVLEIGTGSGYQTAILAELAAKVYTVEIIKELHESARQTLRSLGYENVSFLHGNGYAGWKEFAPYDKIIVAAAAYYLPSSLVEQLVDGGKLVIPLDTHGWQELVSLTKDRYGLKREKICDCRFVPLIEG